MKRECYRTFILEPIFQEQKFSFWEVLKFSSEVLFWEIVAKELKKKKKIFIWKAEQEINHT